MKVRPLRAGLLVALTGPFLGVLPLLILLIFIAGKYGPAVSAGAFIRQLGAIIIFGYILGGIPAIVAGVSVAYGILKRSWIGWVYWSSMTIAIGAGAPAIVYNLSLMYKVLPIRAIGYTATTIFFLLATVFASLVLRVLIIRLGWMRKRTLPLWEVF
jgi:hypothetical protein